MRNFPLLSQPSWKHIEELSRKGWSWLVDAPAARNGGSATPLGFAYRQPPGIWLRFFLAYLSLNAPNWILGHWFWSSRPAFNVELVIPLLLAPFSAVIASLVLAGAWLLDLLVGQSRTYLFASPIEFLYSFKFLGTLKAGGLVTASGWLTVGAFLASAIVAVRVTPKAEVPWPAALLAVSLLVFLDVNNGSSMLSKNATRIIPYNVAGAPTVTLVVRAWEERNPPALTRLDPSRSATGIADIPEWAAAHPKGRVILVLVESMGLHRDVRLRSWLKSQFLGSDSVTSGIESRETAIPFHGSTTWAELRELCSLSGSYRQLDSASGQTCLPAVLGAQGWDTVGLHGFGSAMFDRADWWHMVGLSRSRFGEDMMRPGARRCGGAFSGACDADVIRLALSQSRPHSFVYALTLNSHLPLQRKPIPPELQKICATVGAGDDVCLLTATLGEALSPLKNGLAAMKRPFLVVIVGDHAPPFEKLADRSQFDSSTVAAFILSSSDATVQ